MGSTTASAGRVEIVRHMTEALSCGDTQSVRPYLDPDFEWVPHVAGFTVKDAYRGVRGLRDWCRLVRAMFRAYAIELEDVQLHDGRVVAIARQRGRSRGSGGSMDETLVIACEFRDGCLRHARAYPGSAPPALVHSGSGSTGPSA